MLLISLVSVLIISNAKAGHTLIPFTGSKADTIPSTELTAFLRQMNLPSFYGKPVDSFLVAVDAIPYEMKIYGGFESKEAMLNATHLWYKYSGGQIIVIYVKEFIHMNRYSPTATWDLNLFRKEKIDKIEVWKNENVCINGWCME